MTETTQKGSFLGYLPNDRPPIARLIVLGFQHVLTMFPATILVAILVGFDVGAVLVMSGVATITALTLSRLIGGKFIPLYYGSSFSYIAATATLTNADFNAYAGADVVSLAQVGIVATGALNIVIGLVIRLAGGKEAIDKVLPPIVTGSVAAVIGIALAKAALDMAIGTDALNEALSTLGTAEDPDVLAAAQASLDAVKAGWLVALITLVSTILFSVYLQMKGFLGLIPILLGAVVGYVVSIPLGLIDFAPVAEADLLRMPRFTLPNFADPRAWEAIGTIAVIAVATIPESTAHLFQIGLYVDKLAERLGREKYNLSEMIGLNLILDGIGDFINGLFGGVAGTNYGENNSLMVITRNYSGPVLIAAGAIAIVLGFSGQLAALIGTIPLAVTGGLAVYLFGVIGMQGIALLIAEKVDLYDPKNLAVGAVILVVGIGGNIGFPGGLLPIDILPGIFPNGLPAIPTAAVLGILLNLIFLLFPSPTFEEPPEVEERIEG